MGQASSVAHDPTHTTPQTGIRLERAEIAFVDSDGQHQPWLDIQKRDGDAGPQYKLLDTAFSNRTALVGPQSRLLEPFERQHVCFVCDGDGDDSTTTTDPSTRELLLRVTKYTDERLHVRLRGSVDPDWRDRLNSLSVACARSTTDLERVLRDLRRDGSHSAVSVVECEADQSSGRVDLVWSPSNTGLQHARGSSYNITDASFESGRKLCAIVAFLPDFNTFATLATFSFWLETLSRRDYRKPVSTPQLVASLSIHTDFSPSASADDLAPQPSPSSFMTADSATNDLLAPPQFALSLSKPDSKRASLQNLDPLNKRLSYQSLEGPLSPPVAQALAARDDAMITPNSALAGSRNAADTSSSLTRPVTARPPTAPLPRIPAGHPMLASPQGPAPANFSTASASDVALLLPSADGVGDMPQDDGPLFRAYVRDLEERAHDLRKSLKSLVRSSEDVLSALRVLDDAEHQFDRSLRGLFLSNPNAGLVLQEAYWDMARKVQGFARKEGMLRLEEQIIDPLKRMASILKTVEAKKRTFEHESKAYSEHLNRHLAVKNEQNTVEGKSRAMHADEKHKLRSDRFSLARLDYYNSLRDLALFKECSTLAILTHYAHSAHDIAVASGKDLECAGPALEDLDLRIDALSAQIEEKKVQIETSRRTMETELALRRPDVLRAQQSYNLARSSIDADPRIFLQSASNSPQMPSSAGATGSSDVPYPVLGDAIGLAGSPDLPNATVKPPPASPHACSPDADSTSHCRRREGFLWTNTKPITHHTNPDTIKHWQKHWVVLAGGQLCEYAEDRLDLHSNPINLRFATVRESRMHDRRFTFEVITPALRKVYQATSDEEARAWLNAITRVIQSLLDGTSSVRHLGRHGRHEIRHDSGVGMSNTTDRSSEGKGSNLSASSQSAGEDARAGGNSEGMRGVFSRLNKPLQRRASDNNNNKHRKRDSMSALVSNFASAAAAQAKRKDKRQSAPLASLIEASQSMSSFFAAENRPPSSDRQRLHPRSVSSNAEQSSAYKSKNAVDSRGDGERSKSPEPDTKKTMASSSTPALPLSPSRASEQDYDIEAAVTNAFGPPLASARSSSQSKSAKERNARELLALLKLPENRRCADCLSVDPRWAAWNLGIFICIRCSGIHRSLGSHVSKVRSVDLDDWSDEQLRSMREIGNAKARSTWEPPDLALEMRSDQNIANLIKLKYVEKRWHA